MHQIASHIFVIHVEAVNPAGHVVEHYSGNIIAQRGVASRAIPIAFNEATGRWQIRAHDLLTGQTKSADFEVN